MSRVQSFSLVLSWIGGLGAGFSAAVFLIGQLSVQVWVAVQASLQIHDALCVVSGSMSRRHRFGGPPKRCEHRCARATLRWRGNAPLARFTLPSGSRPAAMSQGKIAPAVIDQYRVVTQALDRSGLSIVLFSYGAGSSMRVPRASVIAEPSPRLRDIINRCLRGVLRGEPRRSAHDGITVATCVCCNMISRAPPGRACDLAARARFCVRARQTMRGAARKGRRSRQRWAAALAV